MSTTITLYQAGRDEYSGEWTTVDWHHRLPLVHAWIRARQDAAGFSFKEMMFVDKVSGMLPSLASVPSASPTSSP
jgi:hypothetical protein